MALTIKPILPAFGAEISGVDITRPLDEAIKKEILDAQAKWGITVWRDTGLTDETHIEFSRIFGHIELAPKPKEFRTRHAHRELFDASNLDADGNIIDNEMVRLHKKGDQLWHTDSAFMQVRSSHSLLLCHEAPPEGGATWFADTRGAYDDLPQSMKDKIENLVGINSLWWSRKLAGYPFTEEEVDARPSARHPIVHIHKPSGRKALYIAAHTREIEGMEREEGRALIRELIEFATQPKYVFPVYYRPGDMSVWDNLCSMHRGGGYDAVTYRRDMRRTTIREPGIVPDEYDPYTDLFEKSGQTAYTQGQAQPRERVE
jgi:alpha-ketoglutarate-dependent 2,4-dichlorophenoxyacetate dioxygenase